MATDSVLEDQLRALLDRLANRDRVRSEATVQSDVRHLLLSGGLGLADHELEVELETPVLSLAVGAVLGAAAGFLSHAPGRPSMWNDIRGSGTFVILLLGFPAAIYQRSLRLIVPIHGRCTYVR